MFFSFRQFEDSENEKLIREGKQLATYFGEYYVNERVVPNHILELIDRRGDTDEFRDLFDKYLTSYFIGRSILSKSDFVNYKHALFNELFYSIVSPYVIKDKKIELTITPTSNRELIEEVVFGSVKQRYENSLRPYNYTINRMHAYNQYNIYDFFKISFRDFIDQTPTDYNDMIMVAIAQSRKKSIDIEEQLKKSDKESKSIVQSMQYTPSELEQLNTALSAFKT